MGKKNNKIINDKGFWEYSIFQKIIIPNEEQNIKNGLKPDSTIDLKNINNYIHQQLSQENQIILKHNNNIKLTPKELIIYNKYIKNNNTNLVNDIMNINKLGSFATPITIEGKIYYMMYLLETFIKQNKNDNIANLYLKLQDSKYIMSNELKKKYTPLLSHMNSIIENINLIELQFTKFYNQMPPLNQKGFIKFDDWQIQTINNIDNNISTIICAPTSAGKSILSGYTINKGKSLYIVPTDALAWQVAAYIGKITNSDVPIITLTYQSIPKRDEFINLLNKSNAIVGTSESILDYLPLINCNFKWIIYDEIHMIGKKEGAAIEIIAKILNNIPFIGLSATIGNLNELKLWFEKIYKKSIHIITCEKRFFNLQKFFYDNKVNDIIMLHPLGLISINEFKDKSILTKILNQTPQDTWSLCNKLLLANINLGDLDPYIYFNKIEVIELNKTYTYFNELILFMVNNIDLYTNEIQNILYEYSSYEFNNYDVNLINIIYILINNDKLPAIIFQQNTIACFEIVKQLYNDIEALEIAKYPNLLKLRINRSKQIKKENKKLEKELLKLTEKQIEKKIKEQNLIFDLHVNTDINAPHDDFIYNKDNKFSDSDIKEIAEKYKIYFPCINGEYHYLIKLLWRGIGVYINGLPDGFLRLIQKLASNKKLAVVISDTSLVFGISMPFRSAVIYNISIAPDNLDTLMYHQMAGRAGRRGLDTEGNIIFVGYSWQRIKELSNSELPQIHGLNRMIWTHLQVYNSLLNNNYLTINYNMFKSTYTDNEILFFENSLIEHNKLQELNNIDINILQLLWSFRYSNEGIIVLYLLPYLKKYYETCNPNNINKQIEIAYFLSKFINIKSDTSVVYEQYDYLTNIDFNNIYNYFKNKNITISHNINYNVWLSIRNNNLIIKKDNTLRHELFEFSIKLKYIQHYCYHTKQINLTKLLGKLLTRIWWIYHSSSLV